MFLHAFGAYYGLAISLVMNKRDYDHPAIADLQNSRLDIGPMRSSDLSANIRDGKFLK